MASAQLEFPKENAKAKKRVTLDPACYPIFINKTKGKYPSHGTGISTSVEDNIPNITEEGNVYGSNGSNMEVCVNPKEFLEQQQAAGEVDSDEEEAVFVNSIVGASAESLLTLSHYYDGNSRRRVMYSCNVCEEEFKDKTQATGHARIHTGERPFKCLDCEQSFRRKDDLKRHLKIHTGIKAFSCHLCTKEFTRKDSLEEHMILHKDKSERPFPCLMCDKRFVKRSYLDRHARTHTKNYSFICSACGKGFYENRFLVDHISRRHSENPKPYPCPVCDRKCKSEYHLQMHMRTHGENNG